MAELERRSPIKGGGERNSYRFESCPDYLNLKVMKGGMYILKIAGQYVVLTEVEYQRYMFYGMGVK